MLNKPHRKQTTNIKQHVSNQTQTTTHKQHTTKKPYKPTHYQNAHAKQKNNQQTTQTTLQ